MKEFRTETKTLNSQILFVDQSYQRPLDTARVKKIVSNYNPNLVNLIKVSFRDGKYWIFDGQHTWKALILRNGNNDLPVECKVFYGLTREDEARLFAEQFGLSKPVKTAQRFLSLYVAGDVDVVSFKGCVEETGLKCVFRKANGDGYLICYKNAFDIFMKYGESHLKEVLRIAVEAWNGRQESLRREIISGIDIFVRTYKSNDKYSRDQFVKKLSGVSPLEIIRDGKVSRVGGNKRFARQMLFHYNFNKSQKNRLDDIL